MNLLELQHGFCKTKMSDHIEILDAEFPVEPAKFLELMWSDGDFWRSICDQQGIFDFETGTQYFLI